MVGQIHIDDLIVMLIISAIGLYLLVTGIRGLKGGPMTVVNPESRSAWPGVAWQIRSFMHRQAGLPEVPAQDGYLQISGKRARGRAWFYVILGMVCMFVALFYLENVALMR
jgi:hypothetical protein